LDESRIRTTYDKTGPVEAKACYGGDLSMCSPSPTRLIDIAVVLLEDVRPSRAGTSGEIVSMAGVPRPTTDGQSPSDVPVATASFAGRATEPIVPLEVHRLFAPPTFP
jgi:hypothetical protein